MKDQIAAQSIRRMADIDITQGEAEALIAMEKVCVEDRTWMFPAAGGRLSIPLISRDRRENFMLDISRASIRLTKATYQNRARQAIILIRLDLDGPPHPNPEVPPSGTSYSWLMLYAGQIVPCPHLHLYVEGYADKWAIPAPPDRYQNVQDLFATFEAFVGHCNIAELPQIQKGLFS